MTILSIKDLTVSLKKKKIIHNLNLNIPIGTVHVLMGPNGAGKSTLANILIGNNKEYEISGSITYNNNIELLSLSSEEIAINGIFLSFQHPIEIPGLSNLQFFKSFINNKRKINKLEPIDNLDLLTKIKNKMTLLKMNEDFLTRSVNEGFSGGEKKKNEILQMLLLDPKLIILDEIDSGLDINSIKDVFETLNSFKNEKKSLLIITHYSRILEYINVDTVHILYNGKIIKSGKKEIAIEIERNGYF